MENRDSLTVKAENYVSKFSFLDNQLVRFDRIHRFNKHAVEIDALPGLWSVAIATPEPGQLSVQTDNGPLKILGPSFAFIPPFSLVEWDIQPGLLEFTAFLCASDPPPELGPRAFVCSFQDENIPCNTDELFALIRRCPNKTYVRQELQSSVVAEKLKQFIDENYHRRMAIAGVAKQLGYSHSFLSRVFKATYGLSPVEYRTKLRLFDAQMLLLTKSPQVASAGFASGFSDQGRFHKQFRRLFHARPSQFRP